LFSIFKIDFKKKNYEIKIKYMSNEGSNEGSNESYKVVSTPIMSKDGEQICIFSTTKTEKEFYDDDKFSKIMNVKGRVMDSNKNLNKGQSIDGARYFDYDKTTNIIVIRVDDTNVPGFWLKIPIDLNHMYKWIKYNDDIDL